MVKLAFLKHFNLFEHGASPRVGDFNSAQNFVADLQRVGFWSVFYDQTLLIRVSMMSG